jgi:hypothetical protein
MTASDDAFVHLNCGIGCNFLLLLASLGSKRSLTLTILEGNHIHECLRG